MYIWRSRNRRDKRNLLLLGDQAWTASADDESPLAADEITRNEKEKEHVAYFTKRIKELMAKYLDTDSGLKEIDLLRREVERFRRLAVLPQTSTEKEKPIPPKSSVWNLLGRKNKEEPDRTDLEVIAQEELHEMQKKDNQQWLDQFKSRNEEAKQILIEHAVHQAEQQALQEYRIAHPPRHLCVQCSNAYDDHRALMIHSRDKPYHIEFLKAHVAKEEKFSCVEKVFAGEQGRRLRAQRLIFHPELGSQQSRIDAARPEPFRPNLMDGGKRSEQLLRGMFVTGFDPKRGIRAVYRKDGLIRQHLAPLRRAVNSDAFTQVNLPELQDVINDLVRCQDDFIDVVSCRDHPNFEVLSSHNGESKLAYVRFEWNSVVQRSVRILGEFTGWKEEVMCCDVANAKFFIVKELPPGRYKYRFVVDGVQRVDVIASQIDDPASPLGKSNVLLVTVSPIFHSDENAAKTVRSDISLSSNDSYQPLGNITFISKVDKDTLVKRLESINLRNLALYDDGVWALASHIQKNNTIKAMDLSYNDISDEGIQALAVCLPRLLALEVLKLNGNGFGVDSCRYITEKSVDLKYLSRLELSNNRLGDDGMDSICKFLRYNEVLTTIYIDNSYIGDDGMLSLQESLLVNRKLTFISLIGNCIGPVGAAHLSTALHNNASLTSLNLSNNKLQADGVKAIGDSIYLNDTLQHIYLDHVDLLHGRNTGGLHAVCYAIKRNRHLLSLSLAHNDLNDYNLAEIAHALTYNKGLERIDLTNNHISKIWFQSNAIVPTHITKQMPSIQTSLDKNKLIKSLEDFDENMKSHIEDDVKYGRWTKRRLWKRIDVHAEEKKRKKDAVSQEYERIRAEEEHLRYNVREAMNVYKHYLEEAACKDYLDLTAKQIIKYFRDLSRFDPAQHTVPVLIEPIEKSSYSRTSLRIQSIKMKKQKSVAELTSSKEKGTDHSKSSGSSSALTKLLSALTFSTPKHDFDVNSFLHAHLSILTAVSLILEGGIASLMLQPERLEHAMTLLSLPLPANQVQPAVDETLIKSMRKLGLHKLSDYVLQNAQQLCRSNGVQRARVLADVLLHPPVQEAKAIILHSLRRAVFEELREAYRKVNKPLYVCDYCQKRFATSKLLEKHVRRGLQNENHRRFALEEMIQKSQLSFLQEVKHTFAGCFFPAYFELLPANELPNDYYPQVLDKIGQGGRPIGVVEAFRTIKVIDVLGDYLHVNVRKQLGWVRYRKGRQLFLRPIKGFDWDTLHIQEKVSYYRVNDNLPNEIELKIRHRPHLEAEVLGHLKSQQVIACLGRIDNWLQVQYEDEDAGWLMLRPPNLRPKASAASVKVPFDSNTKSEGNAAALNPSTRTAISSRRSPSPVRRRRIGSRADPFEETEEDEDDIFNDSIVTYEINQKKFKSDTRKNPGVNKYKIEVFDHMRYGDVTKSTHLDHLLLLPDFICTDHTGGLSVVLSKGRGPWTLPQEQLFDVIMAYPEQTWRRFDSQESGMAFMAQHPQDALNFTAEVRRLHEQLAHTSQKVTSKSQKKRGSINSLDGLWEQQMALEGLGAEGSGDVEELVYRVEQEDSLASSLEGDEGIESIY